MWTSSSSGCSVLGIVGDSDGELWTETSCVASSAIQALTEQDVIAGQDVPYARLSRELITRASTVRVLACDIQRTLQNIHAHRQHCNVQPGANACWALASEMDMILTALRETQSATI